MVKALVTSSEKIVFIPEALPQEVVTAEAVNVIKITLMLNYALSGKKVCNELFLKTKMFLKSWRHRT